MQGRIGFLLCFLKTLLLLHAHAQPTLITNSSSFNPKSYVVYRALDSLILDGVPTESSWANTPWSTDFVDIEGDGKPTPTMSTRFKMLWDNRYIYVLLEMEEPHVWATLKNHDDVIFHDNDIEVFIDPDGDGKNYFEIEVNGFKTIFDLFLPKPYRNGGSALIPWDCKNIKVGISIEGTLNDPSDIDKKWTVELAIPFSDISMGNHTQTPHEGTIWRMNFSRVQWDTEIVGQAYHRRRDVNGNLLPEHNWVWSPQGVINMHLPERWGYVVFTEKSIDEVFGWHLPTSEKIKPHLWDVYYKQMLHKRNHGSFATKLKHLNQASIVVVDAVAYQLRLEGTHRLFICSIRNPTTNEVWEINQAGEIMYNR
jgi:hypothetical protein